MEDGEQRVTICVECQHCDEGNWSCGSARTPVTNFVKGLTNCHEINLSGDCPHFKGREKGI